MKRGIILIGAALLLGGCAPKRRPRIIKQQECTATVYEQGAIAASERAERENPDQQELLAQLPVPILPAARKLAIQHAGGITDVRYITTQKPAHVARFYRTMLLAEGWSSAVELITDRTVYAVWQQPETVCCLIADYDDQGRGRVRLLLGKVDFV